MRRHDVFGSANDAAPSVCRENYYRGNCTLEGAVQVGEGLDVEHVNFVDEQHARHQLGYTLLYIGVYNFVDFLSQFVWKRKFIVFFLIVLLYVNVCIVYNVYVNIVLFWSFYVNIWIGCVRICFQDHLKAHDL